ncbi:MAG: hypothetical protein KJ053_09430 [Dehalococcoidia bacterium]|nr:hypothetical protein [Dehalococcoidia bacterium]
MARIEAAAPQPAERHGIEVDPALGQALTRRVAEAAALPMLGPQAGLRRVARTLAGAEEFARGLTAPAWSGEIAREIEAPAAGAGEFASHLGSLASLRDPWGTEPLEAGTPFAETLAPAESGTVFVTPWSPGSGSARGGGRAEARRPPQVAARLASAVPTRGTREQGLAESGGTWFAPAVPATVPQAAVRVAQPLREPGPGPQPTGPGPVSDLPARAPVPLPVAMEAAAAPSPAPGVNPPSASADAGPHEGFTEASVVPEAPAEHPAGNPPIADLPDLPLATPPVAPRAEPLVQREATASTPGPGPATPPASPPAVAQAVAETPATPARPPEPTPSPASAPSATTPEAGPSAPTARLLTAAEMLVTPGLLPESQPPGESASPAGPGAPMTLFSPLRDEAEAAPAVQRAAAAPGTGAVAPGPSVAAAAAGPPPPIPSAAPAEPGPRDEARLFAPLAAGEETTVPGAASVPGLRATPMPLAEPFAATGPELPGEEASPRSAGGSESAVTASEPPMTRPVAASAPERASDLEVHNPASFAQAIVRRYVETTARGTAAAVASAGRLAARYVAPGPATSSGRAPAPGEAIAAAPGPEPVTISRAEGGPTTTFLDTWDGMPSREVGTPVLALPYTPAPLPGTGHERGPEPAVPVQRQAAYAVPPVPAARMAGVPLDSPGTAEREFPLAPVAAAVPANAVQPYREAPPSQGEASGTIAPAGAAPPAGEQGAQSENIDRVAERVWQMVRRRLQIERERQRGLP